MSALNPRQLQMFMKPSELRAMPNFEFGDQVPGDSEASLRQWKLAEADDGGRLIPGLTQRIERDGVKEPVKVVHAARFNDEGLREPSVRLGDGHHRYFVQERRERQGEEVYLPVIHR